MKNFILLLFISTQTFAGFGPKSDSGIRGKAYKEIIKDLKTLEEKMPRYVKVIKYGESAKGTPLYVTRLGTPKPGAKTVLISGATHGDEYLNIADRLPKFFAKARRARSAHKLVDDKVIYIVPIFNPDGYTKSRRENSKRKDLNRDFPLPSQNKERLTQNETKYWVKFLEKEVEKYNLDVKLSVDYHCCYGALLFPWSYTLDITLDPEDLSKHNQLGELMKDEIDNRYVYGSTGQILWYTAAGTSKDYYYDKFNALSVTFEGEYKKEHLKYEKHQKWWMRILKNL